MPAITHVHARELLDSRGKPTVEAEVRLDSGHQGRALVPSGASTGSSEALELRDRDPRRFQGNGVLQAVRNVNQRIALALAGREATDQQAIDQAMIELDGTENKSNLGANAILAVSLAVARASAAARGLPLYRYLGSPSDFELPLPMVNIISGGLHATRTLDLQDFLIIPVGASRYSQALVMISDVYHATKALLLERGHVPLGLADEGGFGPALGSHQAALELLAAAVERAGYRLGTDIAFALDVAAAHFFQDGRYHLRAEQRSLSSQELVDLLASWVDQYPIVSIEDGLAEDDWEGWRLLTDRLGQRIQLIGDDLFTTNPKLLRRGIEAGVANGVLVKLNQIGTLSETLAVVRLAKEAGYRAVISARSGETEDSFIADLAVATGAGQIKIGSLATTERLAKYNQLRRIEEELGPLARYPGRQALSRAGEECAMES